MTRDYIYTDFLPEGSLEIFRENFSENLKAEKSLRGISQSGKAALLVLQQAVVENTFDLEVYVVKNIHAEALEIDTKAEVLEGDDITDVPTVVYGAFHDAVQATSHHYRESRSSMPTTTNVKLDDLDDELLGIENDKGQKK